MGHRSILRIAFILSIIVFGRVDASLIFVTETDGTNDPTFFIDSSDTSTDFIDLEFGTSIDARLRYDISNNLFTINRNTDFGGNEIRNVRLENLSTPPDCDGTQLGRIFFDTVELATFFCDGTDWSSAGLNGMVGDSDMKAALYSENLNTNINAGTTDNLIRWNVESFEDDVFVHDNVTNNSRIQVLEDGRYLVSGAVSVSGANVRYNGKLKFRLNGATVLTPRFQPGYIRNATDQNETSLVFSLILDLSANDYFEILVDREGGDGSAVTMNANESTLSLLQLKSAQVVIQSEAPPFIQSEVIEIRPGVTQDVTISGTGFTPTSTVLIPGFPGTINATTVVSPTEIVVNLTTTATVADYNIIVDNEGTNNTVWTGNGVDLLSVAFITGTGTAGTYTESFEAGAGSWVSSGLDVDWIIQSGGTPSAGTGPNGASAGASYVFTEASAPNFPNVTFGFETTDFAIAQSVSFDYHMFGADMGTLEVQTLRNGVWTTRSTLAGQQQGAQGDAYLTQVIDLTPFEVEGIRFFYTSGANFTGDCAIDNIVIVSS